MNIGGAIQAIRKEKKISQIELATLTGITQAAISQIENGTRPGEQSLERIAAALKVPVPVIYLLAMENTDFTKSQQLLYGILGPILRAILLQFVNG